MTEPISEAETAERLLPFVPTRQPVSARLADRQQKALVEYVIGDGAPGMAVRYNGRPYVTFDGWTFYGEYMGKTFPVRQKKLAKVLRRIARRAEQPQKKTKKKFANRINLINANVAAHNKRVMPKIIAELMRTAVEETAGNVEAEKAVNEGIEEAKHG